MKKWFAFLLALLMMCACLSAVRAEDDEFPLPIDTKELQETVDLLNGEFSDLKATQLSVTEWEISCEGYAPFFLNSAELEGGFIEVVTKADGNRFLELDSDNFEIVGNKCTYRFEVPEDCIYFNFQFSLPLDEDDSAMFASGYQAYLDGYGYGWDGTINAYKQFVFADGDAALGITNGEIDSVSLGALTGYYQDGKLIEYLEELDNEQNVYFDIYGRVQRCTYFDDDSGTFYQWDPTDGWYYYEDDEVCFSDEPPAGAVDPATLKPSLALPIPQTPPIESTAGHGVMTKLPVSLNDLADVEEAGFAEDGSYAVTLSGDLQAHDYTTDDTHTGFADLGVFYVLDGEVYETWFLGNEDGVKKEGDTYYFNLPEGAEVLYTRVDMNIYNGNQLYYSYKDDDGVWDSMFYDGEDGKEDDDNFSYQYWYNQDGELHSIGVYNEIADTNTYWHFYGASGELMDYEIEAETDYWITYLPDGSPKEANYAGQYYWAPDTGWYEEAWDEETEAWVVVPAKAPAGLKDPSEYPAPYVFAKEAEAPTWYPHNTVCVAGIEFRDAKPDLTKKWYNFAPIDLSQDSVQTFELVASNKFVVGTVTVTRTGDEVVVDWALRKQGTTDANFVNESEFLTFFSSLDAVTEVEPEYFNGPVYHFGEPISIEKDLGGDTNVLLYIRNVATYCENLSYKYQRPIYHAGYDENSQGHRMMREAMQAIMDADTVK